MNWILTMFFYLVIFNFYYILGDSVLTLLKYKEKKAYKSFLFGFIMLFFVGFIIGGICQLLQTSWILYAVLMSLAYLSIIGVIIYFRRNWLIETVLNLKKDWKMMLIQHLKSFWFVYVSVILFSLLSMTNQLPYLQQNYDDTYYIGKIVNSVFINKLNTENWFNGNLSLNQGFDLVRILNTYELSYGYFGTVFGIDLSFFCRGTMVIHNYILMFFTYVFMVREFFKKNYAQFVILPFSLFLVSHGYLMEHGLPLFGAIRSYDGWQLQTAMFYGGSVCRTICIPLLIIFMRPLFEKITFKSLLIIFIISCTMVSFSTIAIQQIILVALVAIIIKLCFLFKSGSNSIRIAILLTFLGIIGIYLLSRNIDVRFYPSLDDFNKARQEAYAFYLYYAKSDSLMKYGILSVVLSMFLIRKKEFIVIASITLILWWIFYSNQFTALLNLTAFKYFFVSLRTMASVQYLILFFMGCLFVFLLNKLNVSVIIVGIIALFCQSTVGGYIYQHYDLIKNIDFLGSGMTVYGYSLDNLTENDKLMPQLYVDIGNYFNQLPYGNYRLLCETNMIYNESLFYSVGFVFSSNRIETCYDGGCDGITNEEYSALSNFNAVSDNVDDIETLVAKRKIDYILITNENSVEILKDKGYEVVLTSVSKKNESYYLVKTNRIN